MSDELYEGGVPEWTTGENPDTAGGKWLDRKEAQRRELRIGYAEDTESERAKLDGQVRGLKFENKQLREEIRYLKSLVNRYCPPGSNISPVRKGYRQLRRA